MKIYDKFNKEIVFDGSFEDYKKAVNQDWQEIILNCDPECLEYRLDDYFNVVDILLNSKSFQELFDSLEFKNLNIFGDCADLELRK